MLSSPVCCEFCLKCFKIPRWPLRFFVPHWNNQLHSNSLLLKCLNQDQQCSLPSIYSRSSMLFRKKLDYSSGNSLSQSLGLFMWSKQKQALEKKSTMATTWQNGSWNLTLPFPSMLHVNIEAREVASRFYTPAFRCSSPVSKDAPYIWFDFNRDLFYLTIDTFRDFHGRDPLTCSIGFRDLPLDEICRIKNLAVNGINWWRHRPGIQPSWPRKFFPYLERSRTWLSARVMLSVMFISLTAIMRLFGTWDLGTLMGMLKLMWEAVLRCTNWRKTNCTQV